MFPSRPDNRPKAATDPPSPSSDGRNEDSALDVAGVAGRLKKRSVNKMTKLVDEHPDEAVSTLRRWLHGDG